MNILESAKVLDGLGFNVVPANPETKKPAVEWKLFQTERTSGRLVPWFRWRYKALCVVTGSVSGVVVLDIDSVAALEFWRKVAGDDLAATAHARSANWAKKGGEGIGHYYWRIATSQGGLRGRGFHDDPSETHWDFKADAGIVIAPPSAGYEWVRPPWEQLGTLPDAVLATVTETKVIGAKDAGSGRSMLAKLLKDPPVEGGRNDWLARVAGHYAKLHRTTRDAYEIEVRRAAEMCQPALGVEEIEKILESIWQAEHSKPRGWRERELEEESSGGWEVKEQEAGPDNGWLVGTGWTLATPILKRNGKEIDEEFEQWATFDIRALGVVEDEDAHRTYDVVVRRKRQHDERVGQLSSATLADNRKLDAWLANLGVTIAPPEGRQQTTVRAGARLLLYLESQNPPHFEVVPHLGWHDDGFVCHEGVIRSDGLHDFDKRRPDPILRNRAAYHYGFGGEKEALELLSQVLTFHDETVTAVFGSWWAACVLKPQIQELTSQFPFMALEAPSESGKTTGFFSLMLQLNGSTAGQTNPTKASLRDSIGSHASGIVWIDDLDDPAYIMELLRAATSGGSLVKKAEDRTSQVTTHLVAPIVLSGESLRLQNQKALLDRAVQLSVPSPTQRRSLINPTELQWADIVKVRHRFPEPLGLCVYAGELTRQVLMRAEMVSELPALAPKSGGRWGDKIAVVRLGARILDDLVRGVPGNPPKVFEDRVEQWVGQQVNLGSENTLTLKLIPAALRHCGHQAKPAPSYDRWPATPVLVRNHRVWFSPVLLAQWWSEMQHGRIEERTESEEALRQQAQALGLGGTTGVGRQRIQTEGGRGAQAYWYWRCSEDLSRLLLGRSAGDTRVEDNMEDGVEDGVRLDLWATTNPEKIEDPDE